jgi:hypothetical protein
MAQVQARATRIRALQPKNALPARESPSPSLPTAPRRTQAVQVTATTELMELLEDPGNRLRRKQVSQPMPPSQGGSRGTTAQKERLSFIAGRQGLAERGEASFTGQQLSGIAISQELSPFSS